MFEDAPLAAAALSDDADDLALVHFKVDVIKHQLVSEMFFKMFDFAQHAA